MSIEGLAHALMHDTDLDGSSTLRDNGVDNACDLALLCHELENVTCVVIHPGEIGIYSSTAEVRVLIETRRAANRLMSVSPCQYTPSHAVSLVSALA